jgi:hypothetical protein
MGKKPKPKMKEPLKAGDLVLFCPRWIEYLRGYYFVIESNEENLFLDRSCHSFYNHKINVREIFLHHPDFWEKI